MLLSRKNTCSNWRTCTSRLHLLSSSRKIVRNECADTVDHNHKLTESKHRHKHAQTAITYLQDVFYVSSFAALRHWFHLPRHALSCTTKGSDSQWRWTKSVLFKWNKTAVNKCVVYKSGCPVNATANKCIDASLGYESSKTSSLLNFCLPQIKIAFFIRRKLDFLRV